MPKKDDAHKHMLPVYYQRRLSTGEVEIRCGDNRVALCDTLDEADAWMQANEPSQKLKTGLKYGKGAKWL